MRLRKFNKEKAIKQLHFKKNKSTFIKSFSLVISVVILALSIIYFSYARFESHHDFNIINGIAQNTAGNIITFDPTDGVLVEENIKTKNIHSDNVTDSKVKISAYDDNLEETKTIKIIGASTITVNVDFETNDVEKDYICIFASDEEITSDCSASSSGKLGGTTDAQSFVIDGDTISVYFKTDGEKNDYFGYYVEAVGSIPYRKKVVNDQTYSSLPTPVWENHVFSGWYIDDVLIKNGDIIDISEDKTAIAHWDDETDIAYFKEYHGSLENDASIMGLGSKSTITGFVRNTTLTKNEVLAKNGVTQVQNTEDDSYTSDYEIYAWIEDNVFNWWSDAETVYFHPNTTMAFSYFSALTNVDFTGISTEKVVNFSHWFDNCRALTTITGNINTSGLTLVDDSEYTYSSAETDTSSQRSLAFMFNDCVLLTTVDLSEFDTSRAFDMKRMFGGCKVLSPESIYGVSNFDTSNVKSMFWMFRQLGNSNASTPYYLDISNFNTSNVLNMLGMFTQASGLRTIKFGEHFDTSNVVYFNNMFHSDSNLTTIYAKNDFDFSSASLNYGNMFYGNNNLVGGAETAYETKFSVVGDTGKTYAQIANATHQGYFTEY